MRGPFVSLVVVIVLAAAPLARAICDVSCAEGAHRTDSAAHAHHAPAGSMSGHHHSAKYEPNADNAKTPCCTPGVSASTCCADDDRSLASIAATKTGIEAPAIELTSCMVIDHRARDVPMVTMRSIPAASPPSLRTPLRV